MGVHIRQLGGCGHLHPATHDRRRLARGGLHGGRGTDSHAAEQRGTNEERAPGAPAGDGPRSVHNTIHADNQSLLGQWSFGIRQARRSSTRIQDFPALRLRAHPRREALAPEAGYPQCNGTVRLFVP